MRKQTDADEAVEAPVAGRRAMAGATWALTLCSFLGAVACQPPIQTRRTTLNDGTLVIQQFRNGVPHGPYRVEDPRTDEVIAEGRFENGRRVGVFRYYQGGSLIRRAGFVDGRKVWESKDALEKPPADVAIAADEGRAQAPVAGAPGNDDAAAQPAEARAFVPPTLAITSGRSVQAQYILRPPGTTTGHGFLLHGGGGTDDFGVDGALRFSVVPGPDPSSGPRAGKVTLEPGAWIALPVPRAHLSLRIAAFMPLANDDLSGFAGAGVMSSARLADSALAVPDVWGLRLAARMRTWWRQFFYGVDLGADIVFSGDQAGPGTIGQPRAALGHIAGGAGFRLEQFGVSVQTTTVLREKTHNSLGDRFLHSASVSGQALLAGARAHLSLVMPLLTNDLSNAPSIVFGVSYDY